MKCTNLRRWAVASLATAALAGCGKTQMPAVSNVGPLPAYVDARECPQRPRAIYFFTESTSRKGYWPDGFWPGKLIADDGALYGATAFGGRYSLGTVFEISPAGKLRVLHSFKGSPDGDGSPIAAGLVNLGGNFYGVTTGGGLSGAGTVFKVAPSGAEQVLHSFAGGRDGAVPAYALVAMGGKLYGTTFYGGGRGGYGTVFEITTSGKERVIYRFSRGGGAYPMGLAVIGRKLYGTAMAGGVGNGIIFALTPSGAYQTLHQFSLSDGVPAGGLTPFRGSLFGGDDAGVFELRPARDFRTLAPAREIGGAGPTNELTVFRGALYGVTRHGGVNKAGNTFTVTGGAHLICSFPSHPDGRDPSALVALDGKFYGAMAQDGQHGSDAGSIFETVP
jgi:uncharacterized repeat protein (TIGR03803 family)